MKFAKLGRTGLDCSRLGFGTWQIGGGRWKGLNPKQSVDLLKHARNSGVNVFDAAVVYGQYRGAFDVELSNSLNLLGQAFRGAEREKVIVCLKIGQLDEYSHRAVYQPRHLVEQVKRALIQAKTDFVDICLIHSPSISEVKDERALCVVQTLQAMGATRFVGYSFEAEPKHATRALQQGIEVLMLQYNLLDDTCESVFRVAEERGVGVLVGGPFKRGYLTGVYDTIEDLPVSDNYWNWNVRYAKSKVVDILAAVKDLKERAGGARELRQRALAKVLQHSVVASAIVGHRKRSEINENLATINTL